MKKTYLIILLIINFISYAHYGQMTTFTFYKKDKKVNVDIEFDVNHLKDFFNTKTLNQSIIEKYIIKNFIVDFESKTIDYHFVKSNIVNHHFNCKIEFNKEFKHPIQKIHIKNTCLLDYHSEHKNIIHFDMNKRFRSFYTDKNRKSIIVEY